MDSFENPDARSAAPHRGLKAITAKLRDRSMIALGVALVAVTMAGWLYFLGRVTFMFVMWIIG